MMENLNGWWKMICGSHSSWREVPCVPKVVFSWFRMLTMWLLPFRHRSFVLLAWLALCRTWGQDGIVWVSTSLQLWPSLQRLLTAHLHQHLTWCGFVQLSSRWMESGKLLGLQLTLDRWDVSDGLTLAHDQVVDLAAFGIYELVPAPEASSGGASSSSSSRRQPQVPSLQPWADLHDVPVRQPDVPSGVADCEDYVAPNLGDVAMDVAPAAAGEAEASVEGRPEDRPELNEPFSVLVDGVALDSSFPLETVRDACSSLGLGRSGGKMKCLERLKKHLESQQLAAQHSAEIQLRKDDERVGEAPPTPVEPSDDDRKGHSLTHQPYASWCEICVSNRGRQDGHRPNPEPSSGASVVSFDYGFLSRLETEDDPKLVALYISDQHTKLVDVVPTPSKGGRYLRYLTTELCRFIVYTQHTSVTLCTDNEPSTPSLLDCTGKALTSLGITCSVEVAPVGSHQSNGAAEKPVHLFATPHQTKQDTSKSETS